MFIGRLVERNSDLVRATVSLHQAGDLPPNTYVIDLDVLNENAVILCKEAKRLNLSVLAMTKQFGRNPVAMQTLQQAGVDSFVAVDTACAEAIHRAGAPLGHIGHLVQIPRHQARLMAAMRPQYWTVFTTAKAREAGEAAKSLGFDQPVLARVFAEGDIQFESHAGGFDVDDIDKVAKELDALPGCRFAGVTTYPALVFDRQQHQVKASPNLATLKRVAARLKTLGYSDVQVNAPGVTSTAVLEILADGGATQVEPGHGFTGTTPLHAIYDAPERPAMVYLTEVSHLAGNYAFCFGGGLYQCIDSLSGQLEALVGSDPDAILKQRAEAVLTEYQVIDFYGRLRVDSGFVIEPGDSVVFCFRPQVFYTRALVAPVSGIASGHPRIMGLYDSQGREVS
jgi:predicted amino acid racemase